MTASVKTDRAVLINGWLLSLAAASIAFVAWGQDVRWHFAHLSTYQLFPLLGLLAFSVMWSHYQTAALRQHFGVAKEVTKHYFEVTSWIVLGAIILHPGLLVWQLWRDGFGLPPSSYLENYVAPTMKWVALLGSVSLLVFLAYELRHFYRSRTWWKYVQWGSDVAILAVFYHGLRLGGNLQKGWFHYLWLFYGLTLVAALVYIHTSRLLAARAAVAK